MSRMTVMTTGAVSAMAGITTGTQAHGQILGPQAHGKILGTQAHGQATVVASPVVHGQATVVASHVVHDPKSDFRDRDDSKQQGQISQKCVLGGVSVCTR